MFYHFKFVSFEALPKLTFKIIFLQINEFNLGGMEFQMPNMKLN